MYIEPPKRDLSKWADGGGKAPNKINLDFADARAFVLAYREVCERDDRTCQECGQPWLYQPKLRLWIKDEDKYPYDADNMECVCYTCARKREAEKRPEIDIGSIVLPAVAKREGNVCIYCLTGPMANNVVRAVPIVENYSLTDPNDWACSCRTCEKKRGDKSHAEFLQECYEHRVNQAAHLKQLLNDME